VRLNNTYRLDAGDIRVIDEHMEEGVTPYLLAKYPMM
jgi:hypothetical protein